MCTGVEVDDGIVDIELGIVAELNVLPSPSIGCSFSL